MLYVTTRNNRDAFTVNHAMRENRSPDGGHYLPFRHPCFSAEEMEELLQKTSGECIAEVLNLLFNTKLTGWDVEFCIGRSGIRAEVLQHRIMLAECWHRPGYRFSRIVNSLSCRITGDDAKPSGWMEIAVRAAVLFGVYADLYRKGIAQADICCLSGDFRMPVSAWYAKRWGLPVGKIICCCNENNSLWDLISHGQMRTDTVSIQTILPAADVAVPDHLERLIYEYGGSNETKRYLESCRIGKPYYLPDSALSKLRKDIYVSVVSSQRIATTIPSVYRTNGKLLSRSTALAYAGLQDYRAKTGATGFSVLWSEESPLSEAEKIAGIMGIPANTLDKIL